MWILCSKRSENCSTFEIAGMPGFSHPQQSFGSEIADRHGLASQFGPFLQSTHLRIWIEGGWRAVALPPDQ